MWFMIAWLNCRAYSVVIVLKLKNWLSLPGSRISPSLKREKTYLICSTTRPNRIVSNCIEHILSLLPLVTQAESEHKSKTTVAATVMILYHIGVEKMALVRSSWVTYTEKRPAIVSHIFTAFLLRTPNSSSMTDDEWSR